MMKTLSFYYKSDFAQGSSFWIPFIHSQADTLIESLIWVGLEHTPKSEFVNLPEEFYHFKRTHVLRNLKQR